LLLVISAIPVIGTVSLHTGCVGELSFYTHVGRTVLADASVDFCHIY